MTTATPYDGMPILQLLAFKRIVGDNGVRYRLLLSDGQFLHSFCVLATYLNHLIAEETLTVNSIFKVLSHVTTTVHRNGYDDARFVAYSFNSAKISLCFAFVLKYIFFV